IRSLIFTELCFSAHAKPGYGRGYGRFEALERDWTQDIALGVGYQSILRQEGGDSRQRRILEFGQLRVEGGKAGWIGIVPGKLKDVVAESEDHAIRGSDR